MDPTASGPRTTRGLGPRVEQSPTESPLCFSRTSSIGITWELVGSAYGLSPTPHLSNATWHFKEIPGDLFAL